MPTTYVLVKNKKPYFSTMLRPEFFLLVDLREFFFQIRVGGRKKRKTKKALKMTS